MAKATTHPFIIDDQLTLPIKWFKDSLNNSKLNDSIIIEWLQEDIFQRCNRKIASVQVTITNNDESSHLILGYVVNGALYQEKIELVYVKSNVGHSRVWFFICPVTKARCRMLHMYNNRFLHRTAIPNGIYRKQTLSKSFRKVDQLIENIQRASKLSNQLQNKWAKTTYAGSLTKKIMKLGALNRVIA